MDRICIKNKMDGFCILADFLECTRNDKSTVFLFHPVNLNEFIENYVKTKGYSQDLCQLLCKCTEKFDNRLKLDHLKDEIFFKKFENMPNEKVGQIIKRFVKNRKRQCSEFSLYIT